uniref:NDUFAF2 n=1 Tax=Chinchilla lanigera TaxID=34839 RepID=A0A8C2V1K5_CHILA
MGWPQGLFRALWRTLSKEVKEHVGTDQLGNKYYYIPQYTNWRGQTIREKRIIEAAKRNETDYEVGDIPTEWEQDKTKENISLDKIYECKHNFINKRNYKDTDDNMGQWLTG